MEAAEGHQLLAFFVRALTDDTLDFIGVFLPLFGVIIADLSLLVIMSW